MAENGEKKTEGTAKPAKAKPLIAKRAHSLHQNSFHREIKKGDDVSDVPAHLLVALRTEKVID